MNKDFANQQAVEARSRVAPRVAVLVPCRNEAVAVAAVVRDFRAALPDATIYVYDNGSIDDTAAIARDAGAVVRSETVPGKGNVVRRMFADIDADSYLLVDGDDTYEAAAAPRLLSELNSGPYDMVTGNRVTDRDDAYRTGHRFGNRLLTGLASRISARPSPTCCRVIALFRAAT